MTDERRLWYALFVKRWKDPKTAINSERDWLNIKGLAFCSSVTLKKSHIVVSSYLIIKIWQHHLWQGDTQSFCTWYVTELQDVTEDQVTSINDLIIELKPQIWICNHIIPCTEGYTTHMNGFHYYGMYRNVVLQKFWSCINYRAIPFFGRGVVKNDTFCQNARDSRTAAETDKRTSKKSKPPGTLRDWRHNNSFKFKLTVSKAIY